MYYKVSPDQMPEPYNYATGLYSKEVNAALFYKYPLG